MCIEIIQCPHIKKGYEKISVGFKNDQIDKNETGKTHNEERGRDKTDVPFFSCKKLIDIINQDTQQGGDESINDKKE